MTVSLKRKEMFYVHVSAPGRQKIILEALFFIIYFYLFILSYIVKVWYYKVDGIKQINEYLWIEKVIYFKFHVELLITLLSLRQRFGKKQYGLRLS